MPSSSAPNHVLNTTSPVPLTIPLSPTEPTFVWGSLDSSSFMKFINEAYVEVGHWRNNFFSVPYGQCEKSFVSELIRLFRAYVESSSIESVALKAVTVVCVLVLQRPHYRAKPHKHISYLTLRLELWRDGQIEELLSDGCSIQQRLYSLKHTPLEKIESKLASTLTNLMFNG